MYKGHNSYHHRKWIWQAKFKFWTRQVFVFTSCLCFCKRDESIFSLFSLWWIERETGFYCLHLCWRVGPQKDHLAHKNLCYIDKTMANSYRPNGKVIQSLYNVVADSHQWWLWCPAVWLTKKGLSWELSLLVGEKIKHKTWEFLKGSVRATSHNRDFKAK